MAKTELLLGTIPENETISFEITSPDYFKGIPTAVNVCGCISHLIEDGKIKCRMNTGSLPPGFKERSKNLNMKISTKEGESFSIKIRGVVTKRKLRLKV